MEDIIINGINLNDLQKQKIAILQEASVVIAENIDLAKSLTKQLVEHTDKVEMRQIAAKALHALEKASFISDVSGVQFDLPYTSSYSGYYDKDTLSAMLENSKNEVLNELFAQSEEVRALLSLVEEMEYQSKYWDSSIC